MRYFIGFYNIVKGKNKMKKPKRKQKNLRSMLILTAAFIVILAAIGIATKSAAVVLWSAFFFAAILVCMPIIMKRSQKEAEKKRAEIERERKVLYYGTAIIRGVGGSLFLTDCALEFYPLNQYKSYSGELIIPLNKIKAIQSAKSKIFVYTAENDMYFVIGVTDNAEWEKQIAAVLPENACNE